MSVKLRKGTSLDPDNLEAIQIRTILTLDDALRVLDGVSKLILEKLDC
jgi:hypothetical protein